MADKTAKHVEAVDAELVRVLKAHDAAAWTDLYDRHYRAIWRYAVGKTGSREAADDVAAQVFLEALQSIDRFRPQGKPIVAWLYTIARNHAAKWVRRHRREIELAPDLVDEGIEGAVVDTISVARALNDLTKDQRDVIALRHYAGCSTAEIAVALGKKETAVYSLETRALAALRRRLAPQSENLTPYPDEIRPAPGI